MVVQNMARVQLAGFVVLGAVDPRQNFDVLEFADLGSNYIVLVAAGLGPYFVTQRLVDQVQESVATVVEIQGALLAVADGFVASIAEYFERWVAD